ncbi:hypothetical protein CRYUN_Cryun07bG0011700 [Craigia yunnanensis]
MLDFGFKPNLVTVLIMVSACAYLGSQHLERKLHNFMIDKKIKIDATLRNVLVDTATRMIDDLHPRERNTTSWNVLISGYGMHGYRKEVLNLFPKMQQAGIKPDPILLLPLLSACSHAGLIDEGRKCFADMKKHSVTPQAKHYSFMVDMLGIAGLLHEAFNMVQQMPIPQNDGVWGALLLACRIHGDTELGWQEVGKLRQDMKDRGLRKPSAFSVIEFGKEIDPETSIQMTNNLRICNDCNSAFKFVSYVYGRKVIVRDANQFHHFQDGTCSCNDYW